MVRHHIPPYHFGTAYFTDSLWILIWTFHSDVYCRRFVFPILCRFGTQILILSCTVPSLQILPSVSWWRLWFWISSWWCRFTISGELIVPHFIPEWNNWCPLIPLELVAAFPCIIVTHAIWTWCTSDLIFLVGTLCPLTSVWAEVDKLSVVV